MSDHRTIYKFYHAMNDAFRAALDPVDQGSGDASMGKEGWMDLKPGSLWASQVCATEVMVVRPPTQPVSLECGGHPMTPVGEDEDSSIDFTLEPAFAGGSLIGRRFADPDSELELLVTKAGDGSLAVDGISIPLKEAKPLPSMD